jgi:16S rRNA (uracil1498-N3)-methyltransferase
MAQRYFLDSLPTHGSFELRGDTAHHLATVLRAKVGEHVRLGDGRGRTVEAVIRSARKDQVQLEVLASEQAPPPARCVHVAFAPPRLNRAEWLFEHGTEVGIAVFHPLWTTRTRPQGERPERWQKIVAAALGQCDRAWLPRIEPAQELADFLAQKDLPAHRFLAAAGGPPLQPLAGVQEYLLLVGPEGGFSAGEHDAALAAGFLPRGLGPHTLRTETAALVGAALLLAQ